jgi:hypothetical protein
MNFDVFSDVRRYTDLLHEHADIALADAQVLEIGYGPRPYRMLALRAMGVDVRGIDAEKPVLRMRPAALLETYRRNGLERTTKTLIRRLLFDWRENQAFRRALRDRRLPAPVIEEDRLLTGDATQMELPAGRLDLIYSEDVFEHLELEGMRRLLPRMAQWLGSNGIAVIRPNIFTGITGGHLVEWNRRSLLVGYRRKRRTRPWEHLLVDPFYTNTYLNRLTRADFRTAFSQHFEILAEEVALPNLGREFLTREIRELLAEYDDDELFSNEVRFVLRPR